MSAEVIAAVWRLRVCDPTRKLVLLAMANEVRNVDGIGAYASLDTYATNAECSVRTVQRHIATLLSDGFIREGDQSLAAHIPARYRPIVYDLALSQEMAKEWSEGQSPAIRGAAVAAGAKGGAASAAKRASERDADSGPVEGDSEAPLSGDSPTPLSGDSPTPLSGDSPTPLRGDSATPLETVQNRTKHLLRGDMRGDIRGDTGVTQTVKPLKTKKIKTFAADAARGDSVTPQQGALLPETPEERIKTILDSHFTLLHEARGVDFLDGEATIRKHIKAQCVEPSVRAKQPNERILALLAYFASKDQLMPARATWLGYINRPEIPRVPSGVLSRNSLATNPQQPFGRPERGRKH